MTDATDIAAEYGVPLTVFMPGALLLEMTVSGLWPDYYYCCAGIQREGRDEGGGQRRRTTLDCDMTFFLSYVSNCY